MRFQSNDWPVHPYPLMMSSLHMHVVWLDTFSTRYPWDEPYWLFVAVAAVDVIALTNLKLFIRSIQLRISLCIQISSKMCALSWTYHQFFINHAPPFAPDMTIYGNDTNQKWNKKSSKEYVDRMVMSIWAKRTDNFHKIDQKFIDQ